ncbi:MAG: anthranilate phosphoribosyltransferase [Cyanobacteriota bacterium]
MLKRLIAKASNKQNLTVSESYQALNAFTTGEATTAQISALLTALKIKGETVDELTGFACAMKENAIQVNYSKNPIYDCCGTGGDMASTINVSTAAAILASAAGVYIAKHSNKSVTSLSGSSDVLGELDIELCSNADDVVYSLDTTNIAFLHAPSFHVSTKNVSEIRKEIGIRTIFNLLGPLTNPANPDGQLIGVSSPDLCPIIAETLKNLKMKRAMVVCATKPRLDELSISGPTIIYELNNNNIKHAEIIPEDLCLKRAPIDKVKGSDPKSNAKVITDIFEGNIDDSRRDIIVLNTAAILWIANKVESLKEGINVATMTLFSGKAYEKLMVLKNMKLQSQSQI